VQRKEISEKLKEIIAEITGFEPEEIDDDSSLSEDIGIESFDIVDINFSVEEVFGVEMGDGVFWNVRDIFEKPELIDENNVLTLEGILEIKRRIPNVDPDNEIESKASIGFTEMLAAIKVKNFIDFLEKNTGR
jgi:acyl carrier protein